MGNLTAALPSAEADQRLAEALTYYEAALTNTTLFEDLWNYQRSQISIGRVQLATGEMAQAVERQIVTLRAIIRNPIFGFQIDSFVEIAQIFYHAGDAGLASAVLHYCAENPECFQPTRDRATAYLAMMSSTAPDGVIALPAEKSELAAMLLNRLMHLPLK